MANARELTEEMDRLVRYTRVMDPALTEFFKIYGPLLLGWVAAYMLWKQNKLNDDRYHEEKIRDVEAKIKHENILSQLIEVIKDRFK